MYETEARAPTRSALAEVTAASDNGHLHLNGNGSGTAAAEGGSGNRNYCITDFVDQGSVESSRYFYARRTVCEMLRDRGYDVPGSELTRSHDDFRRVFGQQPNVDSLRVCVSLRSNPSSKEKDELSSVSIAENAARTVIRSLNISKERNVPYRLCHTVGRLESFETYHCVV